MRRCKTRTGYLVRNTSIPGGTPTAVSTLPQSPLKIIEQTNPVSRRRVTTRNGDLYVKSKSAPSSSPSSSSSSSSLPTHVQKLLLNSNPCAQSKRNQNFLVLNFDFVQSVARSVTTDHGRKKKNTLTDSDFFRFSTLKGTTIAWYG